MNIVLLITVALALTLVRAKKPEANPQPCQKNPNKDANNQFVQKHILQNTFDRNSLDAWKTYLEDNGLCSRPAQSFFEGLDERRVNQICNGKGRQFDGNLCISDSNMPVYFLKVKKDCKNITRSIIREKVVVACDKIKNQCLPVHFEKSTNQNPPPDAKRCKP